LVGVEARVITPSLFNGGIRFVRRHLLKLYDLPGIFVDIRKDENACLPINLHRHGFPYADRSSLLIGECH
jgi:hypothetical protein